MQESILEKSKKRIYRGMIRLSGAEWESNAKRVHGEKYDYSKAIWGNKNTHIRVLCRKCCLEFYPSVAAHIYNKTGCPKCVAIFRGEIMRRRIFTKEHRRKLSESGKRRKITWTRVSRKIDKFCPVCGSKFSVMPSRNNKRFCSRVCAIKGRKKGAYNRCGKNNPKWKGGITPLRVAIWRSKEYHVWRGRIFARDKKTCQECGTKTGILQVHHTPYEFAEILRDFKIRTMEDALNCSILWDEGNGRVMCVQCHRKTYKFKGNQFRK